MAPIDHGASPVDGLQYADPTEALGVIDAPEANNEGSATASFPLDVPTPSRSSTGSAG